MQYQLPKEKHIYLYICYSIEHTCTEHNGKDESGIMSLPKKSSEFSQSHTLITRYPSNRNLGEVSESMKDINHNNHAIFIIVLLFFK